MFKSRGLSLLGAVLLCVFAAGCGSAEEAAASGSSDLQVAGGENLTLEGVSIYDSCGFSGCSVIFYNTVCNRGAIPVYGSNVAGRWGGGGSIYSSCSGYWNATDTFGTLNPGACISVMVYGPGWVGPTVARGSYITYTGMVDYYCQLAETNESDNTQTVTLLVP